MVVAFNMRRAMGTLARVSAGAAVLAVGASGAASMSSQDRGFSTWGWNQFGQLGHGDQHNRLLPTSLEFFTATETPIDVACGTRVTGIISKSGGLWTWGSGQDGRLGHGDDSNQESPRQVSSLSGVKSISFGNAHGLAIVGDGSVYSFGRGYNGQLGLGDKKQRSTPEKITALSAVKIAQVACGGDHSLALTSDGVVYSWGRNQEGQLGAGEKRPVVTPQKIDTFKSKVKMISAGGEYSAALTEDGQVYTWGSDSNGQLGNGKQGLNARAPVLVTGMRNKKVVSVNCGEEHMAALTDDGEVYTWGYGRDGQLGHGTNADECLPRKVDMKGVRAVQAVCGDGHTAILGSDGKLFMFGRGRDGQLGRADHIESVAAYRASPVLVSALQDRKVVKVALGSDHTCAITAKGN